MFEDHRNNIGDSRAQTVVSREKRVQPKAQNEG
jgi:hypothetical protein